MAKDQRLPRGSHRGAPMCHGTCWHIGTLNDARTFHQTWAFCHDGIKMTALHAAMADYQARTRHAAELRLGLLPTKSPLWFPLQGPVAHAQRRFAMASVCARACLRSAALAGATPKRRNMLKR